MKDVDGNNTNTITTLTEDILTELNLADKAI